MELCSVPKLLCILFFLFLVATSLVNFCAVSQVSKLAAGSQALVVSVVAKEDTAANQAQPVLWLRRSRDGNSVVLAMSFAGQMEQTVEISNLVAGGSGEVKVSFGLLRQHG
jgi:hypothetical protein